ncbi:MAG TPA: hypothetical protein VHS76_17170 [Steroidobacteraceae bacterium]|nr:hypothetical protein [Steroidobacteraceae bacterium]
MGPADVAALNKRFFDALKPGGVYLVIDHVAGFVLEASGCDAAWHETC